MNTLMNIVRQGCSVKSSIPGVGVGGGVIGCCLATIQLKVSFYSEMKLTFLHSARQKVTSHKIESNITLSHVMCSKE